MRTPIAVLLALLLLLGGCGAEPVDITDRSTPAVAVRSGVHALAQREAAVVEQAFVADTQQQQEYVAAMVELLSASNALRQRAAERFGTQEANQLVGAAAPGVDHARRFEEAETIIQNDTATLRAPTGETIRLRRVDEEWKIIPEDWERGDLTEAAAAMRRLALVLEDVTRGITGGEVADVPTARALIARYGFDQAQ